MAKILFFGRFSDLSGPLDLDLPKSVTNTASLTSYLETQISGFDHLAALADTRISVNMMVTISEVDVTNGDEIAYMSALSGG